MLERDFMGGRDGSGWWLVGGAEWVVLGGFGSAVVQSAADAERR